MAKLEPDHRGQHESVLVGAKDVHTRTHELLIVGGQQFREQCSGGEFDFIVVGSGFCCFSFLQKVLVKNPSAKVLILEKGDYILSDHFQNLPDQQFEGQKLEQVEKFPWNITQLTKDGQYLNKGVHGQVPCFGGKSVFWSAWSPKPLEQDMPGWPEEVKQAIARYFQDAEKLLNITTVDEISDDDTGAAVYGALQKEIKSSLQSAKERGSLHSSITRMTPAPLAAIAKPRQGK